MSNAQFSIVTPSYNQVTFIGDALDSVRAQTYPNVEHIVVDGGSEDGTVGLLERYETTYDLRWESEPDEGQSHAINKGFERASGDIIGWLNSDDAYFDPGVLERVREKFERIEADVIYGDTAHIDESSRVYAIHARGGFHRELLTHTNIVSQPALFFRGEVVRQHKLRTDLEYVMDHEFWLRLSESHDFRRVHDVFAAFREHAAQKTSAEVPELLSESEQLREKYPPAYRNNRFRAAAVDLLYNRLPRKLNSLRHIIRFDIDPPTLAFDGELAPTRTLLANTIPNVASIGKYRRELMDRDR